MKNNDSIPQITVLMSFYNEKESYLRQSIESILSQTFTNFEFLIIDDNSTDETCKALVRDYAAKDTRIVIVENSQNIGLTRTLNKGIAISKGEFIARIDADDLAEKNRLEKQFTFLKENPDYALCGTWSIIIDENDKVIGKKKGCIEYENIKKRIVTTNFFTHSSLFFKKNAIVSAGGYNENYKKSQDYELLLRLIPKNKIKNLPEFLCRYRIRTDSISFSDNKAQEKNSLKIRLKALKEYGYPKRYYLKLIRPLFLYFLVPSFLKIQLMKLSWKI